MALSQLSLLRELLSLFLEQQSLRMNSKLNSFHFQTAASPAQGKTWIDWEWSLQPSAEEGAGRYEVPLLPSYRRELAGGGTWGCLQSVFPLIPCCPKDGLDMGLIPDLQKEIKSPALWKEVEWGRENGTYSLICWGGHTEEFTEKKSPEKQEA